MRVKLFTLRFTATLGGFDERPVQEFTRDKELLAFREHFFCVNDVPHLTCVVTWQDQVVQPSSPGTPAPVPRRAEIEAHTPARRERARPDPVAGLNETERQLFNRLREWRLVKARAEGVPPYVLFTNRELAPPGDATSFARTGHCDILNPAGLAFGSAGEEPGRFAHPLFPSLRRLRRSHRTRGRTHRRAPRSGWSNRKLNGTGGRR